REKIQQIRNRLSELNSSELANVKIISVAESQIERSEEIKKKVKQLDICPLCQNKITEEHLHHVFEDSDSQIRTSRENKEKSQHTLEEIRKEKENSSKMAREIEEHIRKLERELNSH